MAINTEPSPSPVQCLRQGRVRGRCKKAFNAETCSRCPALRLSSRLLSALVSFAILLGLTPIEPVDEVVLAAVVINLIFVIGLVTLVFLEIRCCSGAARGKAAAKLHIRVVALFSIVAIVPAILVAIVASITLDVGLDRWFSIRTKSIVNSSLSVAEAYVLKMRASCRVRRCPWPMISTMHARSIPRPGRVHTVHDAPGNRTRSAGRVSGPQDGSVILQAEIETERPLPAIPRTGAQDAVKGQPTLIPPGVTNLVGALMPLQQIEMHCFTRCASSTLK
jgi:two-component system nitrogen regulation sensor histidine kinase NtrY